MDVLRRSFVSGFKGQRTYRFWQAFCKTRSPIFGQDREQTASIKFKGNKKQVEINSVAKNSAAALIEKYCAVVFSPEHLNLIKRGPSERRKFIDSAICREKLKNAVVLSKYNRTLNQRNSLLKDIYRHPELEETLSIWDNFLLLNGAILIKQRMEYLQMLEKRAAEYHLAFRAAKNSLKLGIYRLQMPNTATVLSKFTKNYAKLLNKVGQMI